MSFFNSAASPLLCIHAAAQIQHIQASGLWGILMEAVQSTTYCPVCLKCSTSQTALRPLKEWKQVLLHHHHFTQVFHPSLTSIPTLSSPISITFSLINHTPTPSPFPPHPPPIPPPLSGEEKQTAVRVRLADEFQMTLKGRGADQLSPEKRPDTYTTRTCCHQKNMARSLNPHTYGHTRNVGWSCSVNQYCILSQPTIKWRAVCACVDVGSHKHTRTSSCWHRCGDRDAVNALRAPPHTNLFHENLL